MFSRMGSAAFKKDITNTVLLCKHLGNPQNKFKTIHVGGTNGKGSVSHMLAAILQKNGYKTGLYTSPHLYDFRERIRINGEMISEDFVVAFVEKIIPQIEKLEPSFFEITVGMAFEAFAEQKVDVAIIEVGLGGRLDSTNIIHPELSVITNIGWDHMNLLGDSLEAIAFEKAGIIKTNVPVVIGEAIEETKPVFEKKAKEVSAPLYFAEQQYQIINYQLHPNSLEVSYEDVQANSLTIKTDLAGIYQVQNIRTVLAAIEQLRVIGFKLNQHLSIKAFETVKQTTGLMGRWEMLQQKPAVVLEVAHNKEGIEKMVKHLAQLSYRQLHLIIGMVKDKELESVFAQLPKEAAYYFTNAHIPRALLAEQLQGKAKDYGLAGDAFSDVNAALHAALQKASIDDVVIVCGSIFLVAEVDKARLST
ncbi:MAG TPA: folylpolyglutamate synthase/dihydrofolate synthase family protein [Flavisolibacter sp.]